MNVELTREEVEEYIKFYKAEFNEDISYEEAKKQGKNLAELIKIII